MNYDEEEVLGDSDFSQEENLDESFEDELPEEKEHFRFDEEESDAI